MICFTDSIKCAPSVQLSCGHVFHYECVNKLLKKRWNGPRIMFNFLNCSVCKKEIEHPLLDHLIKPLKQLKLDVENKALQRLNYDGLVKCKQITDSSSIYFNQPLQFALSKYAYYQCHKCNKSYYGGAIQCELEADLQMEYDAKQLVCGACSNVASAKICPKHGTDFLEYKCRYCCSVAVFFCFGTTHFCRVCHDMHGTLNSRKKHASCPVGPGGKQLEGGECPLKMEHPPTGEEFALGCGICRNSSF